MSALFASADASLLLLSLITLNSTRNSYAHLDTCDMRRAGLKLQQLATQHLADPILAERLLSNSHAGTSSAASLSSGTTTFARVLHLSGRLAGYTNRVPVGGLLSLPQAGAARQQRVGTWHLCCCCCCCTSPQYLRWREHAPCLHSHDAFNISTFYALLQLHARLADLFRRGLSGESGPQKSKHATGMHGCMQPLCCRQCSCSALWCVSCGSLAYISSMCHGRCLQLQCKLCSARACFTSLPVH
jgi:hypothetical protein